MMHMMTRNDTRMNELMQQMREVREETRDLD